MDGRRKRRFRALYGGIPSRNGIALFKESDLSCQGGEGSEENVKEKKDVKSSRAAVTTGKSDRKSKDKKQDISYF